MFAEKQKLVADLEAYGAGHGGGAAPAPAAPAEAPAGLAFNVMSDRCSKSVLWHLKCVDVDDVYMVL